MKKHSSVPAAVLVAALLFVVGPLFAQSAPVAPTGAYSGPRFPGGPDSLQALVGRSIGRAAPGATGLLVVRFELKDGYRPQNFEVPGPPMPVNPALMAAAAPALLYLQANMPNWQPAPPAPDDKPGDNPKVCLALHFGVPASAYYYPDVEPVFPDLSKLIDSRIRKKFVRWTTAPASRMGRLLSVFLQVQVRYPPQAQRNGEQGTVVAYFELAETGAIENAQIVGTAGPTLDTEVLQAVRKIPAALRPAQVNGRAVRLYFTLPCVFRIQ